MSFNGEFYNSIDAKNRMIVPSRFRGALGTKCVIAKGEDKEYRERNDGRPIDGKLTKARYVRCYSNGSSSEPVNNYIEIEVFGK